MLKVLQSLPVISSIKACDEIKNYQGGLFDFECRYGANHFDLHVVVIGYNFDRKLFKLRMPWGKDYGVNGNLLLKDIPNAGREGPCNLWVNLWDYFVR